MHWSKRLQAAIDKTGWTIAELSRRSGVSVDKLHKYRKGKVEQPRGDGFKRLAETLNVSPLWIEHGLDDAESKTENKSRFFSLLSVPVKTMDEIARLGGNVDAILSDQSTSVALVIPGVGARAFGIRIHDLSMQSKLSPGDVVVVDPDAKIEPGCVVLALIDGKAIVRRVRHLSASDQSKIELVPENIDFPNVIMSRKQPGRIIGRAVQIIKQI